jgi:hypothetical protein
MRAQLSGRLGNQLFELAHAFELSRKSHRTLNLFWDDYSYPTGLGEDLSKLNLGYLQKSNATGLVLKVLDKIKKHSPAIELTLCRLTGIYREEHIKKSRNARIVSGFYQDYQWAEKSFEELSELVARAKVQVQHFVDRLQLPQNYQVLHYRSGDYLDHAGNFGVLSLEYFQENLDETLPVIVLTDSYDRACEVFQSLRNCRVISPEECDPWAALIVMSEAQLVISSNSTLGWWGAFFAIKKGGMAVIPMPFFANGSITKLYHPSFSTSRSIFGG